MLNSTRCFPAKQRVPFWRTTHLLAGDEPLRRGGGGVGRRVQPEDLHLDRPAAASPAATSGRREPQGRRARQTPQHHDLKRQIALVAMRFPDFRPS